MNTPPGTAPPSAAMLLAGAILIALGQPAAGAAPPAPEDIRVTASRSVSKLEDLPMAVTVLTRDDIQRGRTLLGLDEALNVVPGVFVQNRNNFAQDERISVRGFGARSAFGIRGVSILVDGIPATLPDGQSQVDAVDLGATERIEVLRGPAAALYGNAAGGVIRITTTNGAESESMGLRQTFGAFNLLRTQLHGGTTWATGDVYVSANQLRSDGFRDHSAVKQRQLNAKVRWRPRAATEFTVVGGLLGSPQAQDAGGINAAQAKADPSSARDRNISLNAGEKVNQQRLGGRLHHQFGAAQGQQVELGVFGLRREFSNRLPITGGGQVTFDRRFTGADLRYQIATDWIGIPQQLSLGFDHRQQQDDRQRFDNGDGGVRGPLVFDQQEALAANGLWVRHRAELHPKVSMVLGARWDKIGLDVDDAFLADGDDSGSRSWGQISPSVGFLLRAADGLSLFANYGTAFQTPTTTELANPVNPSAGGGFNRSLGPQTARSYEIGARGHPHPRLDFEAVLFRTDIDDAIASYEVPRFSGAGRDFFRNAGRAERYGFETTITGRPTDSITVLAAYTWLQARFERFVASGNVFDGNDQPGIPPHQFNLRVTWEPGGQWFIQSELMAISDFPVDNANRNENPGYRLLDLRASRRIALAGLPGWELEAFAGINNLTNTNYNENARVNAFGGRYYEPAPGRNLFGGFEITRRRR